MTRRAVGAVGALMTAAALAAPAGCASSIPRVPMPAGDAEPGVVVRAYLDALEVEDCATARALYRPGREPVAPWCGEVEVADTTIAEVQDDGCCGTGASYARSVYVPVDVVTHGGEPELPDGDNPWGYVLVRDATDQPWRIADEGLG